MSETLLNGTVVIDEYGPIIQTENVPTDYPVNPGPASPIWPDGIIIVNPGGSGGMGTTAKAETMTSEERLSKVPAAGELIWDDTLKELFAGDGVTPGGVSVAMGGGITEHTTLFSYLP